MAKPRKHRFVTECVNAGCSTLTVWPSPNEKLDAFEDKLAKVRNDPRVVNIEAVGHIENGYMLTIDASKA